MKKLTKDQQKGLAGTIIFHVILLVLLLFLALRTPLPLPGEEGVEVNLGYDETGYGKVQKDNPPPKATPPPKPKAKPAPPPKPEPVAKQQEENLTQETEEAPVLEKKAEKKKPEKKVKKEPEKKQPEEQVKPGQKPVDEKPEPEKKVEEKPKEKPKPQVNKRALFKGSSKNKNGQSQGVTKGGGDQGKPHGYKDSDRYDGQGGEGNGIAFSLGGRGSKYLEKPGAKFNETGTVVVSIWVDPNGKVIRARVNPKGTTVLDSDLRNIAVQAALNSTFAEDPTAPAQQRGTITYEFVLMK
jgi:TonB family protein